MRVRPRVVTRQPRDDLRSKRVDPYWIGNILERLFSTIFERVGELRTHVLVHRGGDADSAGLRQRFEASGYVDSIPQDVVIVDDDITEIDADAQYDALRVRESGVPPSHRLLQRDGASHRLHRTRELHQNAVAFDPDDPPSMSLDVRRHHVPQYALQTPPRADLVLTSKAAIADHVGKQDCFQSALHALLRHRVPSDSIRRAMVVDRR